MIQRASTQRAASKKVIAQVATKKATVKAAAKKATTKTSARTGAKKATPTKTMAQTPAKKTSAGDEPRLLAGDNPQIAKGDGAAPVRAYIAAIPGWKQAVAKRLDALIVTAVPSVKKAVKWNSPFYGVSGNGYFLSFHCFAKYVKVAFFSGADLDPLPPGTSKQEKVRYLDVREHDAIDEKLFRRWVKQAAALPGWTP